MRWTGRNSDTLKACIMYYFSFPFQNPNIFLFCMYNCDDDTIFKTELYNGKFRLVSIVAIYARFLYLDSSTQFSNASNRYNRLRKSSVNLRNYRSKLLVLKGIEGNSFLSWLSFHIFLVNVPLSDVDVGFPLPLAHL